MMHIIAQLCAKLVNVTLYAPASKSPGDRASPRPGRSLGAFLPACRVSAGAVRTVTVAASAASWPSCAGTAMPATSHREQEQQRFETREARSQRDGAGHKASEVGGLQATASVKVPGTRTTRISGTVAQRYSWRRKFPWHASCTESIADSFLSETRRLARSNVAVWRSLAKESDSDTDAQGYVAGDVTAVAHPRSCNSLACERESHRRSRQDAPAVGLTPSGS